MLRVRGLAKDSQMALARNIVTVGSGTLISRLLAYARDAGIAALLGTGPVSEAFFVVLQVVNFFRRLLADGALNGSFVPLWLGLRAGADGAANADRFTRRSLVAMLCIGGIAALLVANFARPIIAVIAPGFDGARGGVAAFFLLSVAPYIVFAALVAALAAALNAEGRVHAVAASTVAFNIVMLLALAWAHGGTEPMMTGVLLSVAVLIAGAVQLCVTGAAWLLVSKRWQHGLPHIRVPDQTRVFFRRAFPGVIAAGIPQLKLIAATAIVSSSPAAVSWLYYANRLYEFPLGVASVAIAAVMVPRIAKSRRAGGGEAYANALSRACEIALGLALPAATGFALLAPQIAGGLFEHGAFTARDTSAVAAALVAICAGLPGHVLEKWLGAASFAHEDTYTPMLAALCGLAAAIAGGLLLFPRTGYVGAAAAIAISGWVGAAVLGATLYRRGWLRLDGNVARRLPRIVVATIVMGAAVAGGVMGGHGLFPVLAVSAIGRLTLLAVLVTLGLAIYAAALEILGVAKLKHLIAALRRQN
jgi:putative peptidoglycan lipid II flippase